MLVSWQMLLEGLLRYSITEEMAKQLIQSETKVVITLSSKWYTVSKATLALKQRLPIIVLRHEVNRRAS